MSYQNALATALRGSALPYGYTLTIWTSGAVLGHFQGLPDVAEAVLFLAGGAAAFAAAAVTTRLMGARPQEPPRGHLILAGSLNFLAISLAVGAVIATAQLASPVAWALGSFAATVIHLLVAAGELAAVTKVGPPAR